MKLFRTKSNFLVKVLICLTAVLTLVATVFSLPNVGEKNITADAETVEYQDLLAVENRDWGAASDEYYFGGYTLGASTDNNAHWLNTDASVNGCWYNGNNALITANNGVDILQYIYVNDTSARDAITANVNAGGTMVGTNGWLTNPAASPVYVETTNGSGLLIKILKAYAGESYTLTFKAGFSLIRNDGNVIYLSDDVVYHCVGNVPTRVNKVTLTFNDENSATVSTKRVVSGQAIGALPEVPAKDGYVGFWTVDGAAITENSAISADKTATPVYALEYQDLLGIEDRTSWGACEEGGEYYFGGVTLDPFGYFNTADSVSNCWYVGNNALITANNGVDIMQYIYVNGTSARDLITANANGDKLTNSCSCWLSNPAASPVYVETTNGSGIMIKLLKAYAGESYTLTFKAGFSLIRNDGEVIYVSGDITYTYANGTLGGRTVDKTYKLSFEGTDETRKLKANAAIGELPAVPEKAGYTGVWTIDGEEITADTVYTYDDNKTATLVYSKDITETIGLGDWGVPETESDIRYLWIRDDNAEIITAYPNSYWNDHADNKDSNFGVDIMEYILIDGESVRSIINANEAGATSYKASSTFPLNDGGCYAPVCIETSSDGIRFKVMVDYKTSFKVTFKAGFTLVNTEGAKLYTTTDVAYVVGAAMGDITKVTGYILTFEGASSNKMLEDGDSIGELPEVPAKDGYTGVWTVDGEKITADTVYNYGMDKTAVAVYTKDVTDTITIEFSSHTAVQSNFKIFITPANALCSNNVWNLEEWKPALIAANNGVDIMEYIYINDENIRTLSNNNRTDNTYPVEDATGWMTNSDQCRPVCVETNSEGIWVSVLHAFSSEDYKVTLKAGFAIADANGGTSVINEDVEFICTSGGGVTKVAEYTLSFDGADSITVTGGYPIGSLPEVPEKDGCEGVWTIDGVEITENTVYTYNADKTAVAAYSTDITKYIALEDRTSWAVCDVGGEFAFGVLDRRAENEVVGAGSSTYYLNSTVIGCWYVDNSAPITANNGVDIMQYIYINDTSARDLITANVNGDQLIHDCNGDGEYSGEKGDCWLANPVASPVYVETTIGSGIMIKVLEAYVGNYFEITLKSGFSLINEDGVTVYLSDDVTYKYIVASEGTTFAKGELTDDDLDQLNGQPVTIKNGDTEILTKTTCRLTLPQLDPVIVGEEELSQVLVGWTTDPDDLSDLYPAGYKMDITEELTLYAVWLGFELQKGAAVRLASGSSGIRFLTDIDAGGYKLGVEKGLILGAGTFLVPTDYVETGVEFVHSSFSAGYYMDRPTDIWKVNGETDANATTWTYAAAFVGISENQYARQFSARGYLKIKFTSGEGYVYTPYVADDNARSIYEVAVVAYQDEKNPQYKTNTVVNGYIDNVANVTWDENYDFAATSGVPGNYTINGISISGNTVTVNVDGDVSSAVVNGRRVASGASSNVKLGNFIFKISNFTKTEDGFTFDLGAASKDYDKQSEETLYFESSDADLDFFLNDYFKRHSGYVENGTNLKVNSATAGVNSEEFFSHEWMSMSYYWFNSFEGYTDENGDNSDRIAGLRNFLSNVPVDDYGYVWSSNDRVRDPYTTIAAGEQKMGWPFPNNDTVNTAHWEFNGESEGSWSNNIGASTSGGLYTASLSGQSSNITFTSNSFSSWTSKKIYTFYAPLLEFEVRIDDATNVEDIYVWYTTSDSTSFSDDKKVSVKDKAFLSYDIGNCTGAYNHVLYLPMYNETAWGESTSVYVRQLKIEIVLKSGTTISGNVGLNYVRPTLDTRMSNNNSIFISSLRTDYEYTGDLDFLTENITRARKAMMFLYQMYNSDRGLKKESYLVGHGGTKESLLFGSATNKSIASSISQGYWDIMYMPEYDFQSNVYFYKALTDMAYLEQVLSDNSITVDNVKIKKAQRDGTFSTVTARITASRLTDISNSVLTALQATTEDTNHTGFWDAADGRFVAGYASGEGKWYDYGYVAWNLEAIYYGVATDEQAAEIMEWLESEGSLYDYVFAPRSNTVSGTDMLNGEYAAKKGEWDFGDNCQYGGAIMYTSFYDLMARIDTLGADNAFARLTAIQNWYKEVYDYYEANGTDPYDFYRYYYDNKGIQCQGVGTAGAVGLDREFLESFLPVSAVAYGFFGIDADGSTLQIAPELPAELTYWSMENLAFNQVKYDLTIYENAIQLTNVRGTVGDLELTVSLDYTEGQSVYVNGAKLTSGYAVENGKVSVTVDFGAAIVEVR